MSRPQVVFADLDGTLISEPHSIGPGVEELLRIVSGTGGTVVPVSARPVTSIASLFQFSSHISYLIGSGGAVVARSHSAGSYEVVSEETITPADGWAVIKMLDDLSATSKSLLFLFKSATDKFEVNIVGDPTALPASDLARIAGDRPVRWANAISPNDPALGLSILVRSDAEDLVHAALSTEALAPAWRATTYPEYRLAGWSWLEIFARLANKATACQTVLRQWGTEHDVDPITIALGDAADDAGMLRIASRSYCPITASMAAQAAVTEVINEPGGEAFVAALIPRL